MTKKGRKPILTDSEAKHIVNTYVRKFGTSKEIRYIDLHNYCVELYEKELLFKLPSESFWRKKDRTGRKIIDEINSALSHKIEKHDKNHELENLLILIDNKITNKELKSALFNELESKQKKVIQLEKKLSIKEKDILSLKRSHEDLKKLNNQQQELISQTFHYFLNKSSHDNLNFFDIALKKLFSDPLEYLTVLQVKEKDKENQNNVADFFKNRLNRN